MKTRISTACAVLLTVVLFFCVFNVRAQGNYEDVVYLKNGSVVRGIIIEQIPGKSIKIQTAGRSVFVYTMEEIEKMTREEVSPGNNQSPQQYSAGKKSVILLDGLKCYQGSYRLSKSEVSRILQANNNMQIYKDWKRGQSNLVASSVLIGLGVPITLLGVAAGIGYSIDQDDVPFIIMCSTLPVGLTFLSAGIGVHASGRKKISRSIDAYNASLQSTSMQSKMTISFGLCKTIPGIGVNLSF
jgi:F0F1-type ATP synthase membrane subunit c/vacuolar-type H+-ATPase subunit K